MSFVEERRKTITQEKFYDNDALPNNGIFKQRGSDVRGSHNSNQRPYTQMGRYKQNDMSFSSSNRLHGHPSEAMEITQNTYQSDVSIQDAQRIDLFQQR